MSSRPRPRSARPWSRAWARPASLRGTPAQPLAARGLDVPVGLAVSQQRTIGAGYAAGDGGDSGARQAPAPRRVTTGSVEREQRVAAHPEAQRLDGHDLFRRDVAEVHVGCRTA